MTTGLIAALLQLTVQAPALSAEIKALFSSTGVTQAQEDEARAILAKDPNTYFQSHA